MGRRLENDKSPFIIAHEFFDALPIHAFQLASRPKTNTTRKSSITTSTGLAMVQGALAWSELLVSPTAPPSPFDSTPKTNKEDRPEFELTLSPGSTPHSKLLPMLSPRWAKDRLGDGAVIEVSPEARTTAATIAQLIGGDGVKSKQSMSGEAKAKTKSRPSGAALIIDYGPPSTTPSNTLRGIRAHKRVSPFIRPGQVDLSSDVDFASLIEAALEASESIECHGPASQADWLESMGGRERRDAMLRRFGGG